MVGDRDDRADARRRAVFALARELRETWPLHRCLESWTASGHQAPEAHRRTWGVESAELLAELVEIENEADAYGTV